MGGVRARKQIGDPESPEEARRERRHLLTNYLVAIVKSLPANAGDKETRV